MTTRVPWSDYFDEKVHVRIDDDDVFCVYKAGTRGPFLVFIHGAGHTALTWSCVTQVLKSHCRIIAMDLRGHGETKTTDEYTLSTEQLVQDVQNVMQAVLPPIDATERGTNDDVILIGHSMGGALAVHVAHSPDTRPLKGVMVIDVVEGTALSALRHMSTFLHARPKGFVSEESAIQWSIESKTVRNITSSRVSIPSQLLQDSNSGLFHWRTDLLRSEQYWTDWFTNLSDLFLNLKPPTVQKALVLAGTDRLDTTLTRGQMQGKFQLVLIYGCGHVIQEDNPDKTAETILAFCNRITPLPGLKSQAQDTLQAKLERAKQLKPV